MNYYLCDLPNTDLKKEYAKRAFLWLGIVHFVTGLTAFILLAIINWRLVFAPAIWFAWGFVYGNIGHLIVVDYRYEYTDGTLVVSRHRTYGKYKKVASIPMSEVLWLKRGGKQIVLTNCEPTVRFVYEDNLYLLSPDNYLRAMLKGENYVFGQCGDH